MLKNKVLHSGWSFCILLFGFWLFSYAQEQFVYNDKGKRDPFIPLVTPDGRLLRIDIEAGVAGLSIEGIIYDENGLSYVLINGEVRKIGDKVSDYQVLKIEKNKVIFIKEGQIYEVKLEKEEP